MNKNIVVPTTLFFLSALLTVMLNPGGLFLAGTIICLIAVLKYRSRKDAELKLGATLLFRSGLAVIAGAVVAIATVLAAMSGLFLGEHEPKPAQPSVQPRSLRSLDAGR